MRRRKQTLINTYIDYDTLKEYMEYNDLTEEQAEEDFLFQTECDLNDFFSQDTSTYYLVIAEIGTWRGTRYGYKDAKGLHDALTERNCDYLEIYTENGDLKAVQSHHDGNNYITVREWKDDVTDEQKELVYIAILENKPNVKYYITKYTQSALINLKEEW